MVIILYPLFLLIFYHTLKLYTYLAQHEDFSKVTRYSDENYFHKSVTAFFTIKVFQQLLGPGVTVKFVPTLFCMKIPQ